VEEHFRNFYSNIYLLASLSSTRVAVDVAVIFFKKKLKYYQAKTIKCDQCHLNGEMGHMHRLTVGCNGNEIKNINQWF
jgi:hypothetical protein